MFRGLRLAERRGPLRHVFETVVVFPRVGLERLRGRPSPGMVGVSLCRGVVLGAAPALGRVPQGGGLGYGGGDVCLYRADGLAGFLACGDVGAGLRLLRRGFHVGALGYATEKRVAVGFGGLAFVGSACGNLARPEGVAHGCLLCGLLLGSFPLLGGVASPGGFPAFRPWGGFVRRARLRSVRRTL